jgi:uncharacterized membrane protein YgdD (TMEM256/DUF423 family)
MSRIRNIALAGMALAGTAVLLGAFGAHALRSSLNSQQLGWWETAVQYQMWHGLALLGLAGLRLDRLGVAAWLLGLGALVFSGSLYLMALTDLRWIGAITPVGGIAMIAGWTFGAWQIARGDMGR